MVSMLKSAISLKKPSKKSLMVALLAAALIAASAVGVYFFLYNTMSEAEWDNLFLTGTFHAGITVDGIDVGGMTFTQARAAVKQQLREHLVDIRIPLVLGESTYVLTQYDFEIADNVDAVLAEAMSVARVGNRVRLKKQIEDIAEKGLAFYTDYTVNTQPMRTRLAELAALLNRPAIDATMQINKDDRENRFTFTDEISGFAVDEEALYAMISESVRLRRYDTVQVPINEVPAEVTREHLQSGTAQHIYAVTSFANNPYNRSSRVANIKKAAGIINGYVLAPGGDFSANTVLGPRTYERGWQPAPAIVRGGSEDQAGGGVCQVSTTLYNAVLKADLEILDRRGHSIQIGYVKGGLDATINTGTIDFVFRNNTSNNVYIFAWVDNNNLSFEIYRTSFPEEFDEIRVNSIKTETLKPSDEMLTTVDNSKPVGYRKVVVKRRNGAVYETWKHYYKNGDEVKSPVLIGKTTYKAYAGEIIVGPERVSAITIEPDETAQ